FKSGWDKHVPFTLLTNQYCRSKEAYKDSSEKLMLGPGNSIIATPSTLNTPNRAEDTLDLKEWLQASGRFLTLLEEFFDRHYVDAWEAHIDLIMAHDRRDDIWPTLLRYDIELRRRATRGPLNPGRWQKNIFEHIESQDIRDERAGRLSQWQQTSFTTTRTPMASTSGVGQYSFRDQPKPHSSNTYTTSQGTGKQGRKVPRCFRCGAQGHVPKYCRATTITNGKPIIVEGTHKSGWTIGGAAFCWSANGDTGCSRPTCANLHLCSLCRSPDHGAFGCPL
ncbi:hypothetical protein BDV93DRAFT_590863, partial [Ceratobasidium sp. AG-I]